MNDALRLFLDLERCALQEERAFGVVLNSKSDSPEFYLDDVFADLKSREIFFRLVDAAGVVVCLNLAMDPEPYRRVGGKRSHGRLSQGEYFHHDGCSKPENPRVVEIRCPPQPVRRLWVTSLAPFPSVVHAMLRTLPEDVRTKPPFAPWLSALDAKEIVDVSDDEMQGTINRTLRQMPAEFVRTFFEKVDREAGAYCEPWSLNESRFIANENPARTAQHRRGCYQQHRSGTPNGHLIKRWPAEELPH